MQYLHCNHAIQPIPYHAVMALKQGCLTIHGNSLNKIGNSLSITLLSHGINYKTVRTLAYLSTREQSN